MEFDRFAIGTLHSKDTAALFKVYDFPQQFLCGGPLRNMVPSHHLGNVLHLVGLPDNQPRETLQSSRLPPRLAAHRQGVRVALRQGQHLVRYWQPNVLGEILNNLPGMDLKVVLNFSIVEALGGGDPGYHSDLTDDVM